MEDILFYFFHYSFWCLIELKINLSIFKNIKPIKLNLLISFYQFGLTVTIRGKPFLSLSHRYKHSAKQSNQVVTMGDRSNGDVLMLEAPPSYGSRSTNSDAEIIDALPYIDDDYSDPRVKIEVDRLVEEEMRRSSKKPADFLKDFPPLPTFNFQVNQSHSFSLTVRV